MLGGVGGMQGMFFNCTVSVYQKIRHIMAIIGNFGLYRKGALNQGVFRGKI